MIQNIDELNADFYNHSGHTFDSIPFKNFIPTWMEKYGIGKEVLEIGPGPGALALWMQSKGAKVNCVEPSVEFVHQLRDRGIEVFPSIFQNYETTQVFNSVVALSSLIHVPKKQIPRQIDKIKTLLHPDGLFYLSLILGEEDEVIEDPTGKGKKRFFSKFTSEEIHQLITPHFQVLEESKYDEKHMNWTFWVGAMKKK